MNNLIEAALLYSCQLMLVCYQLITARQIENTRCLFPIFIRIMITNDVWTSLADFMFYACCHLLTALAEYVFCQMGSKHIMIQNVREGHKIMIFNNKINVLM